VANALGCDHALVPRRQPCRIMGTRRCPPAGCPELCARFESDDVAVWEDMYADVSRETSANGRPIFPA